MKNNSVIICVLALLASVMFYGASQLISDKDDVALSAEPFPDYSGTGGLSPRGMSRSGGMGGGAPRYSEGLGAARNYSEELGISRRGSEVLGGDAFLRSASPYTSVSTQRGLGGDAFTSVSTQRGLGGTRSFSGGIYASSSSTMRSYGGGSGTYSEGIGGTRRGSEVIGGANWGVSTTPNPSFLRRGNHADGGLGGTQRGSELLGEARRNSELLGEARRNSELLGETRSASERIGESQSYSDLVGATQFGVTRTSYSSRHRMPYYDSDAGKWYDDETGEEVTVTSNLPGVDAGGYNGQTITYEGKQYTWNGSMWVYTPSEVGTPIGDAAWLMVLLALTMAIIRKQKYGVRTSRQNNEE